MIINALAITGGMGTGKSTVLKFFKENGYTVYDADQLVNQLFRHTHPAYLSIAQPFDEWLGTNFMKLEGIDKKYLRPFLEKNENGFSKALSIVTPFVQQYMEELDRPTEKIIFEVPLLFEAHMEKNFSHIMLITCNMEERIKRIKIRQPHLSIEQIKQTIHSQKTDQEKIPYSNYILDNSFDHEFLLKQLVNIVPDIDKIYQKTYKQII
jgi:dephospho-CoA kinase